MEYVIPIILVVIAIGGFVTFMVMNAIRTSGSKAEGDSGPGIGQDETPLGDTAEHAGEQTSEGQTVGGQDADASGGTGQPVHSGYAGTTDAGEGSTDPAGAAHVARPGEGEGHLGLEFPDEEPQQSGPGSGSRAAGR